MYASVMKRLFAGFGGVAAACLISCTAGRTGIRTNTARAPISDHPVQRSSSESYRVETVAAGLTVPWAIAFLPDGRVLITERPGRIRVMKNGVLDPKPMLALEQVINAGEGGLMDISIHPKFSQNGFVYVSYVANTQPPTVRVVRYVEQNGLLQNPRIIVGGISASMLHCGCRARIGPDGKLYITTGEKFERNRAQDLNDLCGKTLRVNDDGTIPNDNPFVGNPNARPEIWSYGHRNSQGIAWQPGTGTMFQSEHGPSQSDAPGGGDEINVVQKGKNYGWPVIHHRQTHEGMESPIAEYTPAIAPASAAFCSGKMFPEWKGDLFVGCLKGERLLRLQLQGTKVIGQEFMFQNRFGRIREVEEAPDGSIWFTTSNQDGRGSPREGDDKVFRIVRN